MEKHGFGIGLIGSTLEKPVKYIAKYIFYKIFYRFYDLQLEK